MKRVKTIIIMLLIATAALSAIDFKFTIGQETSSSLEFFTASGSSNRNPYRFNLNTELDFFIDKSNGLLVEINPYMNGTNLYFHIGVGYIFQCPLGNSVDLVIGIGPGFVFSSDEVTFNAFATLDFDIKMSEVLFLRLGTGARVDFGAFGDQFAKNIKINVPLPAIGVGWRF